MSPAQVLPRRRVETVKANMGNGREEGQLVAGGAQAANCFTLAKATGNRICGPHLARVQYPERLVLCFPIRPWQHSRLHRPCQGPTWGCKDTPDVGRKAAGSSASGHSAKVATLGISTAAMAVAGLSVALRLKRQPLRSTQQVRHAHKPSLVPQRGVTWTE